MFGNSLTASTFYVPKRFCCYFSRLTSTWLSPRSALLSLAWLFMDIPVLAVSPMCSSMLSLSRRNMLPPKKAFANIITNNGFDLTTNPSPALAVLNLTGFQDVFFVVSINPGPQAASNLPRRLASLKEVDEVLLEPGECSQLYLYSLNRLDCLSVSLSRGWIHRLH